MLKPHQLLNEAMAGNLARFDDWHMNDFVDDYSSILAESVHFRMPPPSQLPEAAKDILESSIFRLPFERVIVSFDVDQSENTHGIGKSEILCIYHDISDGSDGSDVCFSGELCVRSGEHLTWFQTPGDFFSFSEGGISPPQCLFEVFDDGSEEMLSLSAMVYYGLAWLAMLNCRNVTTVSHEPPHKLNKKRLKSNKFPEYTWKTLNIDVTSPIIQAPKKGGDAMSGRGLEQMRNSPRMHLRRGHVRRLPSGEFTWVSDTVVGNAASGAVFKDYLVK
jgi:hypothetical protein